MVPVHVYVRVYTSGWSGAVTLGAGMPKCQQLGRLGSRNSHWIDCMSEPGHWRIQVVHKGCICVFMCVCLQGIHAPPCYWLELESRTELQQPIPLLDLESCNSFCRNTQSQIRNSDFRPSFWKRQGVLNTSTKYFSPRNMRLLQPGQLTAPSEPGGLSRGP